MQTNLKETQMSKEDSHEQTIRDVEAGTWMQLTSTSVLELRLNSRKVLDRNNSTGIRNPGESIVVSQPRRVNIGESIPVNKYPTSDKK